MVIEIQTFDYVVKDEDGEIIGKYTSTDEPPMRGNIIDLSNLPPWEAAEVVGVTMMLTDHDNAVVLKVKPVERRQKVRESVKSLNRGDTSSLGAGLRPS